MGFNLPILVNYLLRKTEGTVASEEVSGEQFSVQDSHFPYETRMTGDPFQVPVKKLHRMENKQEELVVCAQLQGSTAGYKQYRRFTLYIEDNLLFFMINEPTR